MQSNFIYLARIYELVPAVLTSIQLHLLELNDDLQVRNIVCWQPLAFY